MNTWDYVVAPLLLLADTISANPSNRLARFGAWMIDLSFLSVALPFVIGCLAVWLGYFKPDPDDAKARYHTNYPKEHIGLWEIRQESRYAFDGSTRLDLPSPEPRPFTSPEAE